MKRFYFKVYAEPQLLRIDGHISRGKVVLELRCPKAPLTFALKTSNGAPFFCVRHYARSGFASTDKPPCHLRLTHSRAVAILPNQVPAAWRFR